jgi:hypothetical protein
MNIYLKKQQPEPPIKYADHTLPLPDKGVGHLIEVDLSNYPSLVKLGDVILPSDVAIYLNAEKIIAGSKILDGVYVTEHIGRKPYEIEFEMVVRTQNATDKNYIFPQKALEEIWNKLWLPNSVVTIQNTYLNGLGIEEMIIEKLTPTTLRGSKNLPVRIKGTENVKGLSLIIT